MSLAPITFLSFNKDGRTLMMYSGVAVRPYWDEQFACFVVDDMQLGLKVVAHGDTMEELTEDLVSGMFLNWDTYVVPESSTLRNGQRAFRAALLNAFYEEGNEAWVKAKEEYLSGNLDTAEEGNYTCDFINEHERLRNTVDGIRAMYTEPQDSVEEEAVFE